MAEHGEDQPLPIWRDSNIRGGNLCRFELDRLPVGLVWSSAANAANEEENACTSPSRLESEHVELLRRLFRQIGGSSQAGVQAWASARRSHDHRAAYEVSTASI